jgi:hypothetical protein
MPSIVKKISDGPINVASSEKKKKKLKKKESVSEPMN